jgi:hypothetical protein
VPGRYDSDDGAVSASELADNELKAGSVAMVQPCGNEHGERRGVALDLRHRSGSIVTGQAEPERNFERDDETESKEEETGEEPSPH